MIKPNTIYCGDNLEVMRGFEDKCVNLVYGDPQFFTNKKYETFWKDAQELRMFEDVWVKQGDGRYSKDINVYLNFMEPRIREIYRILKPTGSFYLHCDYHADGYLRVLCDGIFGSISAAIAWKRTGTHNDSNSWGKVHDTILYYTKGDKCVFNNQFRPYENLDSKFNKSDAKGRFRTDRLDARGLMNGYTYEWKGITDFWRRPIESMKKLEDDGLIFYTDSGRPYKKVYESETKGIAISDLWDDIPIVRKELLGYPTQKPEALLDRIIKASSNEGDVVLDAWSGCGTSIAVAKRLNRQYVGIDISPTACRLVANRIGYPLNEIIGLPMNAEEIAALTGYEFQNAVIRLLDPTLDAIKVNKKGADGGIDGSYHDLFISVKKYKAGRKDLDEFVATLYRNKMKNGLFIALDYSSDFTKEVARLGREQEIKIHQFTLAQIVAGKHETLITKENQEHGKLM